MRLMGKISIQEPAAADAVFEMETGDAVKAVRVGGHY